MRLSILAIAFFFTSRSLPSPQASNLNHATELSLRVEQLMNDHRPVVGPESPPWTPLDEDELYRRMLQLAVDETRRVVQLSGEDEEKGELVIQTWAAGFIRMGEM